MSFHLQTTRLLSRVLIFLALPLFFSTVADAQWTRMPLPPNSPYWWSLTDTLSPAELRTLLQDRDAHRERYRASVASAEPDEVVTEQQIHQVSRYVDGSSHPELLPMYVVFSAYASRFEIWPDWPERNAALLKEYGVSPSGAVALREAVTAYTARREQVKDEVRAPVAELMALLRPLLDEVGNENLVSHLAKDEVATLARLSGRDVATLARLRSAWVREPIVEASLPLLERLRDELSASDWEAFRQMLLVEVAPGISVLELREDPR